MKKSHEKPSWKPNVSTDQACIERKRGKGAG